MAFYCQLRHFYVSSSQPLQKNVCRILDFWWQNIVSWWGYYYQSVGELVHRLHFTRFSLTRGIFFLHLSTFMHTYKLHTSCSILAYCLSIDFFLSHIYASILLHALYHFLAGVHIKASKIKTRDVDTAIPLPSENSTLIVRIPGKCYIFWKKKEHEWGDKKTVLWQKNTLPIIIHGLWKIVQNHMASYHGCHCTCSTILWTLVKETPSSFLQMIIQREKKTFLLVFTTQSFT